MTDEDDPDTEFIINMEHLGAIAPRRAGTQTLNLPDDPVNQAAVEFGNAANDFKIMLFRVRGETHEPVGFHQPAKSLFIGLGSGRLLESSEQCIAEITVIRFKGITFVEMI